MNTTEKREKNILDSSEKFEDFKNILKTKMAERLLNTPLQEFSFEECSTGFIVIIPKADEFPYAVKLYLRHWESRTGLSIDWTKAESGDNPEVYEVRPATMQLYTYIYKAGTVDDEWSIAMKRYASALRCAGYKVPTEFYYEYNSVDDPELYEKLYKLYIDANDDYRKRCDTICEAYTEECWKLLAVISEPLQK